MSTTSASVSNMLKFVTADWWWTDVGHHVRIVRSAELDQAFGLHLPVIEGIQYRLALGCFIRRWKETKKKNIDRKEERTKDAKDSEKEKIEKDKK